MKKKIITLFGIITVILIMSLALFLRSYLSKVPENDISVTGNTAGNINNGGMFCEGEDKVYFSNPYDRHYMYVMNKDETNVKLLIEAPVSNILLGQNQLYYYMDTSKESGTGFGYVLRSYGVYRSQNNGKNTCCLDRESAILMQLTGNYLYYQRYNNTDYTKTYRVKTDKSVQEKVSDDIINPACAVNGIIYYNGNGKDMSLYALNTKTNTSSKIYDGRIYNPEYHDGYIYFMDVSSDYRLCRLSLDTNTVEILTKDRVDCFNVGEYNIYYQKNDKSNPALMRMNFDGSNPEAVAYGIFSNINLTSEYAYFSMYGSEGILYHTPVYGSIQVSEFSAARDAVKKK